MKDIEIKHGVFYWISGWIESYIKTDDFIESNQWYGIRRSLGQDFVEYNVEKVLVIYSP